MNANYHELSNFYIEKISSLEAKVKYLSAELEKKERFFNTANKIGNNLIRDKNLLIEANAVLNVKVEQLNNKLGQLSQSSLKKLEEENISLNMQLVHSNELAEEFKKIALDALSNSLAACTPKNCVDSPAHAVFSLGQIVSLPTIANESLTPASNAVLTRKKSVFRIFGTKFVSTCK